ncbi:hypothetical protein GWI33_013170 [Rhynchophorus ferrugineus]|uniref:Uncharacterized protein n=1 Tax=Rhynchophorus ferrugineus TaxID=354439 RepID=A0A834I484_RHYFE|nr:hypothetical protein GWI33_013170 [Rhynchophorus ferrugineus]
MQTGEQNTNNKVVKTLSIIYREYAGYAGGKRLSNTLAKSGQVAQQAKIWILQSQLEESKQSIFQALSAEITAMFLPRNGH